MKRSSLYTLTLLFTGLLVLFSCRKDIEYYLLDRDRPTSEVLENAKIWYLQSIDRENVRQRLKPHWKEAWTVSRERRSSIVVVPANERRVNNRDISIRRFFIFTLRGDDVAGGNIVEFVGEKYDVSKNLDFLLQAFGKEEVTGFDGSFITYDINYSYINSAVFKNGKKINAITEIQNLDKNSVQKALKKYTVFGRPLKKLASSTPMAFGDEECDDVYPTWNGPPLSGFGEDCTVNVTISTTYDPFSGCAISQTITYNSHTCPGDGTGDESGSGEESGSGSGGDLSEPPYGGNGSTVGFSCKSFTFKNITGNWKEAGVKNIRFKVLSSSPEVESKLVVMPTLIFGIPKTVQNGDAETFCASVVQLAMDEVFLLYRYNTTLPSDQDIISKFLSHLSNKMSLKGGTVKRIGPDTDKRVIIKEADYDILGNGNCYN